VRVVVSGALANKPRNGGEAWVRLSYVAGLRRLGHEVSFVEQIAEPKRDAVAWFREIVAQFRLDAALVRPDGSAVVGEPFAAADLLVNVSGNLTAPKLLARARRRAYVDLDPGYTQLWHAQGLVDLGGHDVFFTVGENVGTAHCPLPVNGIAWRPTRPPVVLDDWPVAAAGDTARFTTISSWRGAFGPVDGYGVKAHEFRKMAELPRRAAGTFEIALAIDPADARDRELLLGNGWRLVDPAAAARDPFAFQAYVQGSGAEFSPAQGVYVETRSGWFSDRTARYLAAGKPALVQDTGSPLPSGEGLLTYRTVDEAAAGADAIVADYDRHSRAARRLAEEHFASDGVLTRLFEDAL
jgi:hypothetical protein